MKRICLFAVLSVADLGCTWWLLTNRGQYVYESNPVAGWILARFGWPGVAALKFAVVATVLSCVLVISRRRPRLAGGVLNLGCVTLAAVVGYSTYLAQRVSAEPDLLTPQRNRTRQLVQDSRVHVAHEELMLRLSSDLSADCFSLKEA